MYLLHRVSFQLERICLRDYNKKKTLWEIPIPFDRKFLVLIELPTNGPMYNYLTIIFVCLLVCLFSNSAYYRYYSFFFIVHLFSEEAESAYIFLCQTKEERAMCWKFVGKWNTRPCWLMEKSWMLMHMVLVTIIIIITNPVWKK